MTDPIADMLTRIRNAQMTKKRDLVLPFSRLKFELAKILEKEGFIKRAARTKNRFDQLEIELKYKANKPVIQNLKRISKPSRRVYAPWDKIPVVLNGLGVSVISTSKGLMTNKQARKEKVGGEVLCEIY